MKKAFRVVRSRLAGRSKQDRLLEFVADKKNLEKAVEGSMRKRTELIDRVSIKEKHA